MTDDKAHTFKLTQYSHGAGCGCKIAPAVLDKILAKSGKPPFAFPGLLVGHEDKDDAAVMEWDDGSAIISTTDFFMPIVDDAFTFGKIAATNAISDIYAMGGHPMMAIAILGWPIDIIPPEIAGDVVRGAQDACMSIGIPLAGGHSIDTPEPIFGLAVTGRVEKQYIKKNGGARPGDILFLTKPLGIGILTTAQKKSMLKPEHEALAIGVMLQMNSIGEQLSKLDGVHAMTDVTGFGLAGHLLEMCQASDAGAEIRFKDLPVIDPCVIEYMQQGAVPGGTNRNFTSYGHELDLKDPGYKQIVCDPQTSGGLLIAVDPHDVNEVAGLLQRAKLNHHPIGVIREDGSPKIIFF